MRNTTSIIPLFQSFTVIARSYQGRRASRRWALAPWLSYSAPLALLIVYLRLLEQSRTDQEKDHADQSNQAR